jgi:hypothetical protein
MSEVGVAHCGISLHGIPKKPEKICATITSGLSVLQRLSTTPKRFPSLLLHTVILQKAAVKKSMDVETIVNDWIRKDMVFLEVVMQ